MAALLLHQRDSYRPNCFCCRRRKKQELPDHCHRPRARGAIDLYWRRSVAQVDELIPVAEGILSCFPGFSGAVSRGINHIKAGLSGEGYVHQPPPGGEYADRGLGHNLVGLLQEVQAGESNLRKESVVPLCQHHPVCKSPLTVGGPSVSRHNLGADAAREISTGVISLSWRSGVARSQA